MDEFWNAMTELVQEITSLVIVVRRSIQRTLVEGDD